MKEIKAYIHNHRIADVIRALKESELRNDYYNLSVTAVKSLLKAMDAREQHYSIELAEAVIDESRLGLICEDHQVDELVGIIRRVACTGQSEAGWIYIADIVKAIPITGQP